MLSGVWTTMIIIILIVIVVMKIANKKQEIAVKLTLLLFTILMLTIAHVYIKTDTKIEDSKDILEFSKVYFSWTFSIFGNFKVLTADATNLDWEVKNETIDKDSERKK